MDLEIKINPTEDLLTRRLNSTPSKLFIVDRLHVNHRPIVMILAPYKVIDESKYHDSPVD
jgi:hypothetical protein